MVYKKKKSKKDVVSGGTYPWREERAFLLLPLRHSIAISLSPVPPHKPLSLSPPPSFLCTMISQGPLRFEAAAIFFYLERYSDLNFALFERIRHFCSDTRYDNFIRRCDLFRYIDIASSIYLSLLE